MSTLTVQLPESLKKTIEALAEKEGYSASQFIASAAGEKLAVVLTMDYLRQQAAKRQVDHRIAEQAALGFERSDRSVELFLLGGHAGILRREIAAYRRFAPLCVSRRGLG